MTPNRYTLKCWLRFKGISQSQTDQLWRECAEDYPIKTKMNGKPSDMNVLILLVVPTPLLTKEGLGVVMRKVSYYKYLFKTIQHTAQ